MDNFVYQRVNIAKEVNEKDEIKWEEWRFSDDPSTSIEERQPVEKGEASKNLLKFPKWRT